MEGGWGHYFHFQVLNEGWWWLLLILVIKFLSVTVPWLSWVTIDFDWLSWATNCTNPGKLWVGASLQAQLDTFSSLENGLIQINQKLSAQDFEWLWTITNLAPNTWFSRPLQRRRIVIYAPGFLAGSHGTPSILMWAILVPLITVSSYFSLKTNLLVFPRHVWPCVVGRWIFVEELSIFAWMYRWETLQKDHNLKLARICLHVILIHDSCGIYVIKICIKKFSIWNVML